jgi:hypothetical protein
VAAALGRITASQLDEALLDIPLDPDLVGTRRLPPAQQGGIHSLGDQLLADTSDRPQTGAQGRDDLLIGVFHSEGIVGQQEDAGMGQFAGRRLPAGHHLFQRRAFLLRQGHPIFVHSSCPVLGGGRLAAKNQGTAFTCQMKMDDPLVLHTVSGKPGVRWTPLSNTTPLEVRTFVEGSGL